MSSSNFRANRATIRRATQARQRVRGATRVKMEPTKDPSGGQIILNGPVFQGPISGSQFIFTDDLTRRASAEQAALGLETADPAAAEALRERRGAGAIEEDAPGGRAADEEARSATPQRRRMRRVLAALVGRLAAIATGCATGADVTHSLIERLSSVF